MLLLGAGYRYMAETLSLAKVSSSVWKCQAVTYFGGGGEGRELVGYPLHRKVISFLYRKSLVEYKHLMWESEVR
jgi:hypothetical protein